MYRLIRDLLNFGYV
ncbi:hypothetical protein F383_11667 [Gossypium arboreum]|uniref:Uncharacterized protein n=1 Tax=Gossypium arboreum TaxID=29729 RepID=A0A0B0PTR3_GOSAR|nr:hypothetical protein F383_11667 [Gossypium arboreum]